MKNDYAYLKCFKYKKPWEKVITKRFVIVLDQNDSYIKGIDLQYLSMAQAHECIHEIVGFFHIGERTPEVVIRMYPFTSEASRTFRKDRIVSGKR